PTSVSDAIREPVDLVRTLASERRIKLVVDDGSVAGSFVRADRQRLKQVVLNLLSNAVKYNREAGTVTVRSSEVEGGRLRIEVSDEGPGIHPDSMSRLFAPFERLGAEASEVEGTGL